MWHTLGVIFAHVLIALGAIIGLLLTAGLILVLVIVYHTEIKQIFNNVHEYNLKEKQHEEPASNRQDH